MKIDIILSLIAGSAAVIGVIASLSLVKQKFEAERDFLSLLTNDAALPRLRELRKQIPPDGVTSPAELKQLITSLDQLTAGLSERHRQLIREGLWQPSVRGRARYAAKWMNKAGVASGPLLIATP